MATPYAQPQNEAVKYLLERWEGLELFVRLAIKHDPALTIATFSNPTKIWDLLRRATLEKKVYATELAGKIYDVQFKKASGETFTKSASLIYKFALTLKQELPFHIEKKQYDALIEHLNADIEKEENKYLPPTPRVVYAATGPDKLFTEFQDSWWYLYAYEPQDVFNPDTDAVERRHYIIRQILHFQKFGKVEMLAFNFHRDVKQDYSGGYRDMKTVHGGKEAIALGQGARSGRIGESVSELNDEFVGGYEIPSNDIKHLVIDMRMSKTGEKRLQMMFYIGNGDIDLAIGTFNNAGRKMYAGAVLMEKADGPINRGDINRFPSDSSSLQPHIREFFRNPSQNYIEVANEIVEKDSLLVFMKTRL